MTIDADTLARLREAIDSAPDPIISLDVPDVLALIAALEEWEFDYRMIMLLKEKYRERVESAEAALGEALTREAATRREVDQAHDVIDRVRALADNAATEGIVTTSGHNTHYMVEAGRILAALDGEGRVVTNFVTNSAIEQATYDATRPLSDYRSTRAHYSDECPLELCEYCGPGMPCPNGDCGCCGQGEAHATGFDTGKSDGYAEGYRQALVDARTALEAEARWAVPSGFASPGVSTDDARRLGLPTEVSMIRWDSACAALDGLTEGD